MEIEIMTIKDFMEKLKKEFNAKTQMKYETEVEYLKHSKMFMITVTVRKYNRCGYVKYAISNALYRKLLSEYKIDYFTKELVERLINRVINKEFELETRFGKIPTEVDKWTECREEDREEMEALYRK